MVSDEALQVRPWVWERNHGFKGGRRGDDVVGVRGREVDRSDDGREEGGGMLGVLVRVYGGMRRGSRGVVHGAYYFFG